MGIFSKKNRRDFFPEGNGLCYVIEVEHWFINRFIENDMLLNQLKLQKILYLAYGWHLLLKNEPLFKQPIKSFKYGPIIQETYRRYKSYRSNFINAGVAVELTTSEQIAINLKRIYRASEILDNVFENYGSLSPVQLSSICHQPYGAWDRTMTNFGLNTTIPDEYIAKEFREKHEKLENEENNTKNV